MTITAGITEFIPLLLGSRSIGEVVGEDRSVGETFTLAGEEAEMIVDVIGVLEIILSATVKEL